MGAPKQKWTPEEEAALRAGIAKYGLGKWSAILKDPEFSGILRLRSNVDLKDKWRNINVMLNGVSRQRRGGVYNKNTQSPKSEENSLDIIAVTPRVPEIVDVEPLAVIKEEVSNAGSLESISRLDDLILEAITKLKEPRGSSRASISLYIMEHCSGPSNFETLLAESLKLLTENGRLIKVKQQYRIAPSLTALDSRKVPLFSLPEGVKDCAKTVKDGIKIVTKAQIDFELEMMRTMTQEEAAAAAAKAVAEAEDALAEAELAAREAEEAENEAEVARCFAEAAEKALNSRTGRV